jgi:hypothetical protein
LFTVFKNGALKYTSAPSGSLITPVVTLHGSIRDAPASGLLNGTVQN